MKQFLDGFKRSGPLRKIMLGLSVFAGVCFFATLGYVVAGWQIGDALYMVIITIFGVGYGEVQPIETTALRALTIAVIISGYAAVIYTVGGFMQLIVDGEIAKALGARKMVLEIEKLKDHTVICGAGRLGTILAKQLRAQKSPFVLVDQDLQRLRVHEEQGQLVVHGDATDEQVLEKAGVSRAQTLATVLSQDSSNLFVTITARELSEDLQIIARAENPKTEKKLLGCGANKVVLPAAIGAERVAQLIVRPNAEDLLGSLSEKTSVANDLGLLGLEFNEFQLPANSPLVGRRLAEIESENATTFLAVGIRSSDGSCSLSPSPQSVLSAGDTIIFLGHAECFPRLIAKLSEAGPEMIYRGVRVN